MMHSLRQKAGGFSWGIIICSLLISGISALLALGGSLSPVMTHQNNQQRFALVDHDSWVNDNATIDLSDFLQIGNTLEFTTAAWHPLAYADLEFYYCGKLAHKAQVLPGSTARIYLRGRCLNPQLRIKSLNPVQGAAGRLLAVQLDQVSLTSKLGLPLPSVQSIMLLTALLLPLVLLCAFAAVGLFPLSSFVLPALFASLWVWIFGKHYPANLENLIALYSCCLLLLCGIVFGSRYQVKNPAYIRDAGLRFYPLLFLIVLAGLMLRAYGIDFGLPFFLHPDEVAKHAAIERMRSYGDLNPRYFLHPTLMLYLTYFYNVMLRALAGVTNDQNWMDSLILAGRFMSLTAGTFSIFLTGLIGKKIFNSHVGLISASLLAVFPLHVTCSRYVKEDALLLFFSLATIYIVILCVKENKPRFLLLAGLFAGLSFGTKYTGLINSAIIFAAPFLAPGSVVSLHRLRINPQFFRWSVRALAIIPLTFLLTTPYALFDFGTFLTDFNYERTHMSKGHYGSISGPDQLWMYHYWRSLLPGMQIVPFVFGVAGLGFLLTQKRKFFLLIPGLFLLYYFPAEFVKAKPPPQPERYVLPCLPFIAIAAAALFVYASNLLQRSYNARRGLAKFIPWIIGGVLILMIASPLSRTLLLAKEIKPDTRIILAEWMKQTLPAGSKIMVDWRRYTPQFNDNYFEMIYLQSGDILQGLQKKQLLERGGDYLIISSLFYDRFFSQPTAPVLHRVIVRKLDQDFELIKVVKPDHGTYGFHNPELKVYRIRE